MKPETESILKAMGFVEGDFMADDGARVYLIPRTQFQITVYPFYTPISIMHAIWNAGGEAKKEEIRKAREAYLEMLS